MASGLGFDFVVSLVPHAVRIITGKIILIWRGSYFRAANVELYNSLLS
jgi:hypothetical protein